MTKGTSENSTYLCKPYPRKHQVNTNFLYYREARPHSVENLGQILKQLSFQWLLSWLLHEWREGYQLEFGKVIFRTQVGNR